MNIKLSLVIFLLFNGCAPPIHTRTFTIDTSCDLSIVEGEINGKKTYFLIDTGAGLTIFDINQSKHFDFKCIDRNLEIGGFNNHIGSIKQATGIRSIKINDVDVTGDITYASNMNNLVRFIEECSYKRIGGIIGVPIIKRHGLVIDLTNNRLYRNELSHKPVP